MVKSLRDIIAESLPFLPERQRANAKKVQEKYGAVLDRDRANLYVCSIIMSGISWAQQDNLPSDMVVSTLLGRLNMMYRKMVKPAKNKALWAEKVLIYVKDQLNVRLDPAYRSVFAPVSPCYYGLRVSEN